MGGEAHVIRGFAPLLRMIAKKIDTLSAHKTYNVDAIHEELGKNYIETFMPAERRQKNISPNNVEKRRRKFIDQIFNKLNKV